MVVYSEINHDVHNHEASNASWLFLYHSSELAEDSIHPEIGLPFR